MMVKYDKKNIEFIVVSNIKDIKCINMIMNKIFCNEMKDINIIIKDVRHKIIQNNLNSTSLLIIKMYKRTNILRIPKINEN